MIKIYIKKNAIVDYIINMIKIYIKKNAIVD